jgi:hypothetical protein
MSVTRFLVLYLAAMLLVGCQLPASSASEETQVIPQAVFTAAAQTAETQLLQVASQTPVPSTTSTQIIPTATQVTPLPTATLPPTVTQFATLTAIIVETQAPVVGKDRAEFIKDVTVPDGTVFQSGEAFVKTWRLQNVGDTTWTTDFKVVFVDGDLMDGPYTMKLPSDVPPNHRVDISIDFVAPSTAGKFRGYWKLQNADGEVFGVGVEAAEAFWVDIKVEAALAASDGTPTPSADVAVAAVSMDVDGDSYTGPCPHTYIFTALFALNKPAVVTYNLEGDNDAGVIFKLPPPVTRNLQAGNHSTRFELTFAQSLKGWVRIQFTAPESLTSNRVNFELVCQ